MDQVAFLLISNFIISWNCTTNFQIYHQSSKHTQLSHFPSQRSSSFSTIFPILNHSIMLSYKSTDKIFFIISKWQCANPNLTSLLLRRYPSNWPKTSSPPSLTARVPSSPSRVLSSTPIHASPFKICWWRKQLRTKWRDWTPERPWREWTLKPPARIARSRPAQSELPPNPTSNIHPGRLSENVWFPARNPYVKPV